MNVPMSRPTSEVRPRESVDDVNAETDDDHGDSVVNDGSLNRGVIAIANRQVHKAAHAFEREHGLREDRAAKQEGERESHRRDDGHKGVLETVSEEHTPVRNPAGPGSLDIVRPHGVDHVDPGDPDEEPREDDSERERGEDQVRDRVHESREVPCQQAVNRVQPRDGRRW